MYGCTVNFWLKIIFFLSSGLGGNFLECLILANILLVRQPLVHTTRLQMGKDKQRSRDGSVTLRYLCVTVVVFLAG